MSKINVWSPGGDVRSLIGRNERGKSGKQRVKMEAISRETEKGGSTFGSRLKAVRKINKVYYK